VVRHVKGQTEFFGFVFHLELRTGTQSGVSCSLGCGLNHKQSTRPCITDQDFITFIMGSYFIWIQI